MVDLFYLREGFAFVTFPRKSCQNSFHDPHLCKKGIRLNINKMQSVLPFMELSYYTILYNWRDDLTTIAETMLIFTTSTQFSLIQKK